MKTILIAATLVLGFSGAAFADMNNKPSDYINGPKAVSTTHAFTAVAGGSQSRCDEASGSKSGCGVTAGGTNSGSSN